MTSICIPIYNYYAYPLVAALAAQIGTLGHDDVEIVCIDDGSDYAHKQLNAGIENLARLVKLDANVGRARVRNLFLEHAKGEYMIFLDNDMVVGEGFVERYLATQQGCPDVVVGGIAYDKRYNDDEHRLRYLYGTQVESRPALLRRQRPYASFMTGNFMIRRKVMEQVRFDESLTGYGHEDTLFGYELKRVGIPITHIDNPAENGQVETNADFLDKTVQALDNLVLLYGRMQQDDEFCHSVRLVDAYRRVEKWHMLWVLDVVWRLLHRPMENHFVTGTAVSVSEFNLYKLCLFARMKSEKEK